jgi:signal transduction histidine kinase
MNRIWGSVGFRLALGYGILALGSTLVVSAVFYLGTVGVVAGRADAKLQVLSGRLTTHYVERGAEAVRQEIDGLLTDGIDQDTEVFELIGADGRKVIGNLAGWVPAAGEIGQLENHAVIRNGQPSVSRLLPQRLPDGAVVVVGRDLHDQLDIERIVWRALGIGALCAVLLAAIGALAFRRRLERRIASIRRTAHEIESGDMTRRVPIPHGDDEFARLGGDINRMLDHIENLMEGVRHVSNAIAHDLRTPLGRIRSQLDEGLRSVGPRQTELVGTARSAIDQIDELIRIFDRLLQIAEAESGTRRQSFERVPLGAVIADVVELYDAAAEECGITLIGESNSRLTVVGDQNLLASAVANLIDNALKYAGRGSKVHVGTAAGRDGASIVVEDNGVGIPVTERSKVVERFYRVDPSRSVPGNGLGLSIVGSIASLHWGELRLEDAAPGLRAVILLPNADGNADEAENAAEGPLISASAGSGSV